MFIWRSTARAVDHVIPTFKMENMFHKVWPCWILVFYNRSSYQSREFCSRISLQDPCESEAEHDMGWWETWIITVSLSLYGILMAYHPTLPAQRGLFAWMHGSLVGAAQSFGGSVSHGGPIHPMPITGGNVAPIAGKSFESCNVNIQSEITAPERCSVGGPTPAMISFSPLKKSLQSTKMPWVHDILRRSPLSFSFFFGFEWVFL